MKKTALLASAVVAAMVAGSAAAETTAYGKIRMSLDLAGSRDNLTTDTSVDDKGLNNNSSRFGFKASEDLGNGMTAIARIELGFNADGDGGPTSTRLGYAGLKGDFGTVQFGNQWTPSYLLVRGAHDPFNSIGGNLVGGTFPAAFRVDDALAYINSFGDVQFAAALVASNGGSGTDTEVDSLTDHIDIAVSIPAGPVTVGVAFGQTNADSAAVEKDATAVDIGYDGGDFSVNLGLFMNDSDFAAEDYTVITAAFGGFTVQLEDDGDENMVNLGYTHKLSKKTSVFAEIASGDMATGTTAGGTQVVSDEETNIGIHVNF